MSERGRKRLLWLGMTMALAGLIHYVAIVAYPSIIMSVVMSRAVSQFGVNRVIHPPRITAGSRDVVKPSPDQVYSACCFDVSRASLRIRAPLTGTYMSISMFASNTENFFVINDRQIDGDAFDVILIAPHADPPDIPEARVVRAPSNKGIVLFRYFLGSGEKAAWIDERRRATSCRILRVDE